MGRNRICHGRQDCIIQFDVDLLLLQVVRGDNLGSAANVSKPGTNVLPCEEASYNIRCCWTACLLLRQLPSDDSVLARGDWPKRESGLLAGQLVLLL